MNVTPKYILKIKQFYPELSGKYKAIADYIITNPENVVRNKVREVANSCNCDDALVIRFCHKIGYAGFSDLKNSIVSEFLPVNINTVDKEFAEKDSFSELKQNFLENNNKVLHDTISLLKEHDVKQAAKLLTNATKIYLIAAGSSGIVALDIQNKFMRLGFNVIFHQDSELAKVFFGMLNPEDVVLAVSFSGDTRSVYELATIAKTRGAPVVSITNFPNSILAGLADINLLTASAETVFRLGAMTSRIAQYLIVDFLVIYMALQNIDETEENVLRTHSMISKNGNN